MGGPGSHGTKGNRGGRPKITVSEQQVNNLVRAFKKKAKRHGRSWCDLLAEWAYNDRVIEIVHGNGTVTHKPEVEIRDRLRCIEVFANYVITRRSEHVIENKQVNIVEMPAILSDPAKQVLEERRELMGKKDFVQ